MLESKIGLIGRQLFSRNDIRGYSVLVEGREEKCIVYPALTGEVETGDEVLLNTTAVSLKLGSGGYHYVIARLNSSGQSSLPGGHIMKMRYTPMQVKILSAEEEDSPYHEALKRLIVFWAHRYWQLPYIPCWHRWYFIYPMPVIKLLI